MTDALAALGLLSLITSGELAQWVSVLLVVGLLVAILLPERFQDRLILRQLGLATPILLLVTQAVRLFLGAPVLSIAVELAAGLQIVRLVTRRGAAHDQQVIVLALLHLIAGTVLGSGLAYGLCFLGFLVVAPGALTLSHLRREVEGNYRQGARDRTGLPVDVPRILRSRRVIGRQFLLFTCLLSVPIFIFTALIFLMFPRVGLSLMMLNSGRSERMVGFSDRVDLGGVGTLRSDPTIALRVSYDELPEDPPPRLALYLRGTAFDQYDGRSWSRTETHRTPTPRLSGNYVLTRAVNVTDRRIRIELMPIDPPVLFLPPDAVAVDLMAQGERAGSPPALFTGPEGEFKYHTRDERGVQYDVWVSTEVPVPVRELSAVDRARYLTLPPNLPPRVAALARRWVGAETSPLEQARLIERQLRTEYSYDLASPSGAAEDPLDDFLFESKRGHCEYYSTAMAVLLRTLSVPTRNVTGFIGGSYNRFGRFYAVRQGDAHSWVEVYLEGRGWVRFDPTPPGNATPRGDLGGLLTFVRDLMEASSQRWNRHVVGYDLQQQLGILSSISRAYSEARSRSKLLSSPIAAPRRLALLLAGALLVGGALVYLRRHRARPRRARDDAGARLAMRRAATLYEQLETALTRRGVPRPLSVPPLRHAEQLAALGHPDADEIIALTQLYLEVRFGGRPLDAPLAQSFHQRVKALHQLPPPPPPAAPPPEAHAHGPQ
ncbi:MAG: DUF3488 domain-containing protein [Polyangiaceae bacterium]|nr:DUF3488 domain-containing protein [Polyangiaceae bacterium]